MLVFHSYVLERFVVGARLVAVGRMVYTSSTSLDDYWFAVVG